MISWLRHSAGPPLTPSSQTQRRLWQKSRDLRLRSPQLTWVRPAQWRTLANSRRRRRDSAGRLCRQRAARVRRTRAAARRANGSPASWPSSSRDAHGSALAFSEDAREGATSQPQARTHRAFGHGQERGDLFTRHFFELERDERRTLIDGQLRQDGVERGNALSLFELSELLGLAALARGYFGDQDLTP